MPDLDLRAALTAIDRGTTAAKLEHHRLDFKTEKASTRETWQDLADAAVCFANANGGLIVVGVATTLQEAGAPPPSWLNSCAGRRPS